MCFKINKESVIQKKKWIKVSLGIVGLIVASIYYLKRKVKNE